MASEFEELVYKLVTDYTDASAGSIQFARLIDDMSKKIGASFDEIGAGLSKIWPEQSAQISNVVTLLNSTVVASTQASAALKNVFEAQMLAVEQVDTSGSWYDARKAQEEQLVEQANKLAMQRDANFAKELEDVGKLTEAIKKQDAAQAALNERLKTGKASVSEYSAALSKMISPQTFKQMSELRPDIINYDVVNKVKAALVEIQQATKVNMGEVERIFKKTFANVPTEAIQQAKREISQGMQGWSGIFRTVFSDMTKAVQTFFGTLSAMVVFNIINVIIQGFGAIITTVRKANETVAELEMSLYRLTNAERVLSQEGIDITPKGLEDGIKELQKVIPTLSKLDATQLLGNVAVLTKSLGLTEDQLIDLAKAIAIFNIRSAENEDIMATTQKVVTSLLSGKSVGVSGLGVELSNATILAKALEMGLLKAGEAVTNLSDKEKTDIKVAIAIENAQKELENIDEYMATQEGRVEDLKSAWEDFLATLGDIGEPLVKQALLDLTKIVIGFVGMLKLVSPYLSLIVSFTVASIQYIQWLLESLRDNTPYASVEERIKKFTELFNQAQAEAKQQFGDQTDTPTDESIAPDADTSEAQKEIEDLLVDLQKLDEKEQEVIQKFEEDWKAPDIGTDEIQRQVDQAILSFDQLGREVQDHLIDMKRMWEDYQNDITNTIRDANKRKGDAERKYREREKNEEARFQEQMRQLREKFLFSLEDAIRERDARQVLRLVRQYEMDKTAATNEYELSKQERRRAYKEELADIEAQKQEKLRKLAEEYALKRQREEEDYQLKKAREAEEYKQDLEDIASQREEKMGLLLDALVKEGDIRADAAAQIYKILESYYGKGKLFDRLFDYSNKSLVERAKNMLKMVQQVVAQYKAIMGGIGGAPRTGGGKQAVPTIGAQAQDAHLSSNLLNGGIIPVAMFTPVSGMSQGSSGGFPSSLPTSTPGGGKIEISLTLSPDLEARVVKNTLFKAGEIITKVARSK